MNFEEPQSCLGSNPNTDCGATFISSISRLGVGIRGSTYWKVLVVVEIFEAVIPPGRRRISPGPEEVPSVDIVVRHFHKPLMQRLHSLNWYKGFEAVRDTSGSCVHKHLDDASPPSCLSFHVVCDVLLPRRTSMVLLKPEACLPGTDTEDMQEI
jgi:hypothetical protein